MNHERTEIYGTLGPSCADIDILKDMAACGMSGLRLNLSHGSLRERSSWIAAGRFGQ